MILRQEGAKMTNMRIAVGFVFLFVIGILPSYGRSTNAPGQAAAGRGAQNSSIRPSITLTAGAFQDGDVLPIKITSASPKPQSPELNWNDAPANTVSFTLMLRDENGARDGKVDDVLHWMIFNIPGNSKGLPEGVPAGAIWPDGTIQAKNVTGRVGYAPPGAPATGPYHHYTFYLFALDIKLDLGADATRDDVMHAMDGHILGKGVLTTRFHMPTPPAQ
jgi:Raf kinase inhibitor-like YbhB/YbcL family protein